MTKLVSCRCTQEQLESPNFRMWAERMKEPFWLHRGIWQWSYIAQAFFERDMLRRGKRGLVFGVGQEPLTALFASYGCDIVATDLETDKSIEGWITTNQHAESAAILNARGICPPDIFRKHVIFKFLDMRELPPVDELGTFDFMWSSCSLEHLGSLELGWKFIGESLRYLRPGGVAVHSTEFNILSNEYTLEEGMTVLYRRRDIEKLARQLRRMGYKINLDFSEGNLPADKESSEGGNQKPLINYKISDNLATTCFGLIVERGSYARVGNWNAVLSTPPKRRLRLQLFSPFRRTYSLAVQSGKIIKKEGVISFMRKASRYIKNSSHAI